LVLVDTNVLLDVFLDDPSWSHWSIEALNAASARGQLTINTVIYAEVSIAFARIEELEQAIREAAVTLEPMPREALFLAGKAFLKYRRRQGSKTNVLPDFFVGAHAAVTEMPLLTRDAGRYRSYFPTVELITPTS
jgi:predicted nucleic acid-binding protein